MGRKKKKSGSAQKSKPRLASKDCSSHAGDDPDLLSEELTALSAIFQDDLKIVSESPHTQFTITLRPYSSDMGAGESNVSAVLLVRCLPGYPHKYPKLRIVSEKGLTKKDVDRLLSLLLDQATINAREGRVMIFNLVEAAQEFLSEIVPVEEHEHITEATEADESESHNKNDVLMIHLLHMACSLKGLPVNALSDMLLELNNFGLLSDRARELGDLIPSEFEDVFNSIFEQHKVSTRFPTFWKSSGTIDPCSRYQSDFDDPRFLGSGGFGSVVLCKNKLDGQEYAVKQVRLSSNVEKIEKALREARILAKLYNKRIVRYYQAWTEVGFLSKKKELEPDENVSGSGGSLSDGSFNGSDSSNGGEVTYLYIQMEYCQRTLRGHFDLVDAPAEQNFALNVLRQITEGLKYLHDQGIIHRDLTPSNIFLNDENNVKIGDFGLAKLLEAKQVASGPSSSKAPDYEISSGGANAYTSPEIGAIAYSAPEVVARDPDIDGKVDIFSLGIIYFELLNYFRTGSERARALTDLRMKSEIPSSWIQDYPDQVHWVEWLTSQHPENRPTASELLDALLDIW